MNINFETAARLLGKYGISGKVTGTSIYCNYHDSDEDKVIVRVDVENRQPLVLKLLHDSSVPQELLERQCAFSEHLRKNGIQTPEHYSKGGNYCIEETIDGVRFDVTLEDWCGEEVKKISLETAAEIGSLMAKMHRISFRDNIKLGAPTLFDALDNNEVNGIEKFRELAKKAEESQYTSLTYPKPLCTKLHLFDDIIDIFEHRLISAKHVWDRLPMCAVQGDISINNLTYQNGKLMVFDYNNAGDVTLISDMILEGLLTANEAEESELAEGLTIADRPKIFQSFIDGYCKICPLTHDERIAACELYPAYSALWFSRIMSCNGRFKDSLEAVMERGDTERADEILEETYRLITADAHKIFPIETYRGTHK
ncbi:MAG: hypothetical protein HFE63_00960 [Clostridiales bacterium]|nr:hypothetical protein [Clostridiales bacterium]